MVVDLVLTDDATDELFHALADTTRRDILRRAVAHGDSVSTIARRYTISFAAVQKHVAVLERAGLVTKERRGREQIVRASGPTLSRAAALLTELERQWAQRLDQLDQLVTTTTTTTTTTQGASA